MFMFMLMFMLLSMSMSMSMTMFIFIFHEYGNAHRNVHRHGHRHRHGCGEEKGKALSWIQMSYTIVDMGKKFNPISDILSIPAVFTSIYRYFRTI
jgi:hypothetical protein